jgi:hypothetical protein
MGLLPNQTTRQYFPDDIKLSAHNFESRPRDRLAGIDGSKIDRETLDTWLSWIRPDAQDGQLVWLEQMTPFRAHYKSVYGELTYNATSIDVFKRAAFLIKSDGDSNRPNLREMKFELEPPNLDQSNRFMLVDPDPNETLVIMCLIQAKQGKQLPAAEDCGFAIVRH